MMVLIISQGQMVIASQSLTFFEIPVSRPPGMDHLPVVPNQTVQGLETVPYVCEKPYDGGPFLTYPIREGKPQMTPDEAGIVDMVLPFWQYEKRHPTPNKDFEAFCQTWLFFGLINELLGNTCKSADFVRPDKAGDSKVLSTSQLPGLVKQWVRSIENGSYIMNYEHAAKCLRLTFDTLRAAGPEFDLRVKLCIASVAELFAHATNKAFGIVNWISDNKCPSAWFKLLDDKLWVERFEMSGWCPSQIEIMMRTSTSLQSLHFFASMQNSLSAGCHGSCNSRMCVAYQTDFKHYETQHVVKDCRCKNLYVDVSSMNAVLTNGGFPLLRIREKKTLDELTVEIVAFQPDTCYLALSHVWADGLGNAKANALPRCQLLHLSKLVQSMSPKSTPKDAQTELLFWCDTLCCPVVPGEAKNKVLAQMKSIYERATCVLVLDASIRLHESEGMDPEEACTRILVSGWMRRLWTLQEGALPDKRRVWFQFRDQAVNFDSLWKQNYETFNKDVGRKGLAGDVNWRMRTFRAFFDRDSNTTGGDLAAVEAAFRHRSVSVSSDEPLLIGTLLGLDVARILNGSDETRVHRMWSLMSVADCGVPKDILFRLGPRLREEGYRWAPSSMLFHEDSNELLQIMQDEGNKGTITQHGLTVRLPGYHISFAQRPSGLPANPWGMITDENAFYMRDHEARWYHVGRRWPSAEGDYLSKQKFSPIMRRHTSLWAIHHNLKSIPWTDAYKQTYAALLTRLVQESDKVKYVQSYMHIRVGLLRDPQSEMFKAAYRCAQKLGESAPAQHLANMSGDEVDMESPEYKAVFDALTPEIYRLAASGENELAVAAARENTDKDHNVLFGAIVAMIYIGNYGIMGPRMPNDQQWCVD